jgi:hypothetical protein
MGLNHHGGAQARHSGPRRSWAQTARRIIAPLALLSLVAGLTAACGAASTPLEQYQNCLRCGYNFTEPLPTAQAVLRRSDS